MLTTIGAIPDDCASRFTRPAGFEDRDAGLHYLQVHFYEVILYPAVFAAVKIFFQSRLSWPQPSLSWLRAD